MLREIEHQLRISQWQQTEDAAKRRMNSFPKPMPLSDSERARYERESGRFRFDSLPLDEARERLGWN